jgi:hypothetical protein
MQLTTKTFAVAMLATLFTGMFIGSMLTWKCGKQQEVNIYVPDPLIALQLDGIYQQQIKLRKDLQDMWKTWTFVTAEGETVTVDSTTKWQDVPVIQTDFDDAFAIKVDDSPLSIDIYGYIITKGKPDSLVIRPRKTTYHTQITVKQPFIDLYKGFKVSGEYYLDSLGGHRKAFAGVLGGAAIRECVFIDVAVGINERINPTIRLDLTARF